MAKPDSTRPITVNLYGPDAVTVRRLAGQLPHLTPHRVAVEAMRRGLLAYEAELRDAAARLVTS